MCDFLKSIESNFAQVNNFNRKSDIYAIHSHFQSVITDRCLNSRCSTHEHWAAAMRASQPEPWPRPGAGPSWLRSEITLRSNVTCSRKHSYAGKISPGGNNTSFLDLIRWALNQTRTKQFGLFSRNSALPWFQKLFIDISCISFHVL